MLSGLILTKMGFYLETLLFFLEDVFVCFMPMKVTSYQYLESYS